MTAPNGRANGSAIDNPSELVVQTPVPPAMMRPLTGPQFSTDHIKELIAELDVPFDPAVIEWRVTNTTKSGNLRGQVIPQNRGMLELNHVAAGRSWAILAVRREKALFFSGCKSHPGTGSLHPVAIGAAVKVTKLPEPLM